MSSDPLARKFVAGFSSFDEVFRDLEVEWAPERPPLTILMGDLGRTLVEKSGESFSRQDVAEIFLRVERILEYGTDGEQDAVATGFLEAVVAATDRLPQSRWVLDQAGASARAYLLAWDQFCGFTSTPEQ